MRKILLCITALIMSLGLSGCGGSNGRSGAFAEGETIRVGMECAYAPFNWSVTDPNEFTLPIKNTVGNADGYDVQVARYIAEQLGCEVEIYALAWDSLIIELKLGKIDFIIAGMSPTEKRKEEVYFTDSYYTAQHVVLMSEDSQYTGATQLSDFDGAKGVCQVNTVYNDLLDQLTGVNKLNGLESVNACLLQLTSGAADISIVELPVAQALIAANPSLTYVRLQEQFVLDDADKIVSIALAKGDDELLSQINGVLASLSEETRTQMMNAAVNRQND